MQQLRKSKGVPVKFIAGYCMVSRTTVRRWIKDRKLPAIKLPGGHYRVNAADFRDFLEEYGIPVREELFESKSDEERR